MYAKKESAQFKQEFWTAFGQYMAPVLSAEGEKVNWINYKTGEKHIYFRMQAGSKNAFIAIELTHSDLEIQQLYFDQFVQLKNAFQNTLKEDWHWMPYVISENGKIISRIYKELTGASIFKKEDWPGLISFFKPRIISLDAFWNDVKYSFEALR